jgi:predicted HD phosphohydrolase
MFELELRDRVVKLYEKAGDLMYPGEPINQWQHGWQCAQLAKAAGASHELQVAAWLHDLGHLLEARALNHELLAADWLQRQCNDTDARAVLEPIRLHVLAKRYLANRNLDYLDMLSSDSLRSLESQGGPFSEMECLQFEANSFFTDAVALRVWDDRAKDITTITVDKSVALQQLRQLLANV